MLLNFVISYVIPLVIILTGIFCFIWFKKRKYLTYFLIFILFLLIYSASNLSNIDRPSVFNHYAYLADALNHGRAYVDSTSIVHDVARYKGKIYICHNPLPAVLMMPFVLIYGTQFNDILFTIILGALNCSLVFSMILRLNNVLKKFKFSRQFAFFLTILFGVGTVHWYVAARGTSWHTANITALFFLLLAINEALGKRRYLLMGIFAGLAVTARPSVFWAFPFFVTLGVSDFLLKKKIKEFFLQMTIYVLPYVVLGILTGLWNYIRFGNPLDFGFAYLNHAPNLKEDLKNYGTLNLHFLPINMKIAFLEGFRKIKMFPFFISKPEGMAIEYTSPFFLYFFAPLIYWLLKPLRKSQSPIARTLLKPFNENTPAFPFKADIVIGSIIAAVCTAFSLLLYFNTGWVQFGYRYVLDYIPFLLILVALCMRGRITWLGIVFAIIAFLVNFLGVIVYIHNELNIAFAPLY